MTTAGLRSDRLPVVDACEERQIRESYDEVVVTSRRPQQGKVLHLGTSEGKECGHHMHGGPVRKAIEVYPLGYRPICRECAEIWRRSQ